MVEWLDGRMDGAGIDEGIGVDCQSAELQDGEMGTKQPHADSPETLLFARREGGPKLRHTHA